MTTFLSTPKYNIGISTGVFCVLGFLLLNVAQPWLAWGMAGLIAGLIGLPAIRKEKRTFWRMFALLSAESVGVGLVAYAVSSLLS